MQAILHSQRLARTDAAHGKPFCPAADLPHILRRERARADRTHGGFCVVLLGQRAAAVDYAFVAKLGAVVSCRARETDEVAMVGGRFVCVVLPDTPAAGGRRFAEAVWGSLNGQADRTVFQVLSYPLPSGQDTNPEAVAGPSASHDARAVADGTHTEPADVIYSVERNGGAGGGGGGALLSEFLRHVGSSAACGRRERDSGSLDLVFAAPPPAWKRAMDVGVAGVALICLSPVLLLIAATILMTSGRPVIFKQRRAGLMGRPFVIYKFRTMVVDAERRQGELRQCSEQDGPAFKMTRDPRVTRLGAFLRKTSLDELPQLWNVLKGDMSLVGPRPLPCDEASACSQWQRRRLDVTPGITCIWQVKGRSRVSFPEWMRMDIAYVRSRRLVRDVCLILQTVPAVLLRRGAK